MILGWIMTAILIAVFFTVAILDGVILNIRKDIKDLFSLLATGYIVSNAFTFLGYIAMELLGFHF